MKHSLTSSPSGHDDMPGMDMPTGDGLLATISGYTFAADTSSLPVGKPTSLTFQITGPGGKPVTTFEPDQTKLMHFYLIRSDLGGFQHVHPAMAADGTWTAPLGTVQPGTHRVYASFIVKDRSGNTTPLVLSRAISVRGKARPVPLPAASATTKVDGYTLTVNSRELMAGMEHKLTVEISKAGQPVRNLQPYLNSYAHLTAFHEGDLAFAHLHPQGEVGGDSGGPELTFNATLPKAGNWRLFLQFQTAGALHTAAITLRAG
ncbi:hypothetical protein [Flindersiella endophytica]